MFYRIAAKIETEELPNAEGLNMAMCHWFDAKLLYEQYLAMKLFIYSTLSVPADETLETWYAVVSPRFDYYKLFGGRFVVPVVYKRQFTAEGVDAMLV